MSVTCKYCNEPENKQDRPGLVCETCMGFVHLNCLWRPGTPGDLACDIFFDFVCANCSPNSKEVFKRNKFPWVNVIYLTLYHLNLHSYGISNRGFFHYKTHICSFIDRYWSVLFGCNSKQKKNWVGTIAGALSVYSNMLFKSGSVQLSESGWWRLQHLFSPSVTAHILQEIAREKPKGRGRNPFIMDKTLFLSKVADIGYKDLIVDEVDTPLPGFEAIAAKKRRVDSDISGVSNTSGCEQYDSDSRFCNAEENTTDDKSNMSMFKRSSYMEDNAAYNSIEYYSNNPVPPSDSSSLKSYQHYNFSNASDSRSPSPLDQHQSDEEKPEKKPDIKKKFEDKPVLRIQSLFSTQPNSIEMPWETKVEDSKGLVQMSQYEEVQLLKKVEGLIPKMKDGEKKGELRRLKAKLALRRLKRHKHIPVFDLDKTVKLLGGYFTGDQKAETNTERVLDRFQRSYLMDNLCGTIASTNYGTVLLSRIEPVSFQSPYSGAILKPYIRRDTESSPFYLKLIDQLLIKTNGNNEGYAPPPHASIDYSYVRPQHIPAINNMCAQYFWPGIDVTEVLQYPEFSCVVTYKKLVIAFAFLVPDVSRNETYISFIFTRPEWRNAKIATFMLYHLLQTCTGKDVTLHVSPNNPAIFLYQKFGFKVEELVQDFYEKYFDIDYKGCRHALFLRLVR